MCSTVQYTWLMGVRMHICEIKPVKVIINGKDWPSMKIEPGDTENFPLYGTIQALCAANHNTVMSK